MSYVLNSVSSLSLSKINTNRVRTHSQPSVSFTRRRLTVRAAETDTNEVKAQAPDKAQAGGGSSFNQLLGIKGAAQETNKWKIRLQLTKPVTWPPLVWGVVCGAAASGNFHWNLEDVTKSIVCMMMSGPFLTGYTQTLNDWYDREIDAINEPYRPIPSGAISENEVITQIWLLLLGGLGVAGILDVWAGHDFPIVFYLALGGSLLSYIYSAPPLKLKQNGWIGNFALGASYISLPWWAGQALFGTLTPDIIVLTLLYSIAGLGIAIVNDFKSVEGDRALGLQSLPVAFGPETAKWICVGAIDVTQLSVAGYLLGAGKPYYALALLALIIPQVVFQFQYFLKDPVKYDVKYQIVANCETMSSDDEKEEKELDLSSPEVVTKYKSAAEIVNKALQLVISECKPKAKIVDLCEKGDSFIREQSGSMYKNVKKKIERGVAFPTCISVNDTICHYSPLASDEAVLEQGDMLKIDMGCHIDGFIAVVAHTHVLQQGPITSRAADVIAAANTAAEVALRLVRPGKKNKDVTDAIQKVAAAYDCKIVEGVLSHQLKQFVIDGNKVILSVSNPETRVDDAEFEENEVYAIDIVTSTGDGKPKLLDEKQTTVYKRAVDKSYHLKMKASRFIFSEISQKFPIMPFSARALEEKRARLGLVECVNHDLLQPYPVLHEKPGDLVAHFKFTVLLMPNGSDRVTSHPLQELYSTKTIDDPEIKAWLALGTKTKKKGGGKKKKGKKGDKAEEATEAEPMDSTTDGAASQE
ncbi:Peptidase_M24 domain-containing protein/UbiA domain-containing protein [Cephalotus follicularis]|uniref:Chlorophyll synthase, chloroplastic n=1 Tax=Cephalotus follicularis TaxID=3775 RepID=A0A1Q3C0L4_CEPFO|nr:Peptidase_M24 domain-containing protein/UbiA domain-containing protein [Cephalotus follicularis]